MSIINRFLSVAALLLGSQHRICGAHEVGGSGGSDRIPADVVASDLIVWLRDNGAYINEKLEARHLVPGDESSPRGIFATEALDVGETLCHIPSNLVVKSSGELLEGEEWPHCGTIRAVIEAMSGESATPYGSYLLSQPRNYLPGYWSDAGQELLLTMLKMTSGRELTEYDELPPHGIDEAFDDIEEECKGDMSDPVYRHAAMMVQSRSDYEYMVPFYDMFNHHNGKYNIKHKYNPFESIDEKGYEMITTKAIEAGEELYISYNQCDICQEELDWVGTPEMFLFYGFVESMPQRWLFDFARVKFDLDWKGGYEESGELVVSFLVPPSRKGMDILKEEITRIEKFAGLHRQKNHEDDEYDGVSEYEWNALWKYYDALHDAMSLAVRSNATLSDDVWKLDKDWWVKDGTLAGKDDYEHYVQETQSVLGVSGEL